MSDEGPRPIHTVESLAEARHESHGHENEDTPSHAHEAHARHGDHGDEESLYPLGLIFAYLGGVTLLIGWVAEAWEWQTLMRHFMAGFFLVFSFFKLLDLPGFVSDYRQYDLIARGLPA